MTDKLTPGYRKELDMLGSMYSAISGLQVHQTKLNVIGNNISNVNTYGFKSSRVTFSDVFYQTINGASSASDNSGGTNPVQLGYGAKVNSIDVINTRAGSASTNRALDIYIDGEGYLPVKDSDGIIKYTRVGILSFDASGNLVDNKGNMVLGIPFDSDTGVNKLNNDGTLSPQDLIPINVKPEELDKYSGISIGRNGEVTAIKEGTPTIITASNTPWLRNATLTEDSLYSGDITMTVTRGGGAGSEMTINASTYDRAGNVIDLTGTWTSGDTTISLGDITLEVDEVLFGTLETGDIDNRIIGKAGPGAGYAKKIANLSVAKFINPDGLSQQGNGYCVETTNSGDAVLTLAGSEGTGALISGSLEMSNVDLSREFTEMIIAQRGFQANTRMITVSDEMLSELVNMKR